MGSSHARASEVPAAPVDGVPVSVLARQLGVRRETVRGWCRDGKIPARKTPGGYYRIPRDVAAALRAKHGNRPGG